MQVWNNADDVNMCVRLLFALQMIWNNMFAASHYNSGNWNQWRCPFVINYNSSIYYHYFLFSIFFFIFFLILFIEKLFLSNYRRRCAFRNDQPSFSPFKSCLTVVGVGFLEFECLCSICVVVTVAVWLNCCNRPMVLDGARDQNAFQYNQPRPQTLQQKC